MKTRMDIFTMPNFIGPIKSYRIIANLKLNIDSYLFLYRILLGAILFEYQLRVFNVKLYQYVEVIDFYEIYLINYLRCKR